MIVRTATSADVDAVAAIEQEAFPGDAWTVDYLAAAVDGELPTVMLLVAVDAPGRGPALGPGIGQGPTTQPVVGHALVSTVFELAELQRIAVAEKRRREGVAGAILDAVRDRAVGAGAERLLLEVRETNAGALAFYERAGFVEIDRRPRYYRDGATAIVMELVLPHGR